MITRIWPLTLLVTQLVLGFDHSIDLTRCQTDTACFIRESCLKDKSEQKTLAVFKEETEKLKDDDCDVVLQIKALTDLKFHVMMQVKSGSSEKIKTEDGITLNQGADQFVCKPGLKTGDASLDGAPVFKFTQEGRQIFEDMHLFCSFFAEIHDNTKNLKVIYSSNIEKPKLIFTKASNNEEVEYAKPDKKMWTPLLAVFTCNRDLVTTSRNPNSRNKDTILTEVDITYDEPKCDADIVIVMKSDNKRIDTPKVKCVIVSDDQTWKYDDAGGTMKDIDGDFEMYCPAKRCRLCTTAPPPLDGYDQVAFKSWDADPTPAECSTLTCTNDKWTTTGKEIFEGKAECRGNADLTKFAWFLNDNELEKAACLEKIDCDDRWKSTVEGGDSSVKVEGTDMLKCATAGQKLKLELKDPSKEITVDNISLSAYCDTMTGDFNFTKITCFADKPTEEDSVSAAGMTKETIAIIGGVSATVVVVGILVCCILTIRSYNKWKAKKLKEAAATNPASKKDKSTNNSTQSTAPSAAPGVVDGSEGKKKSSRKSKRDKLKLEDFPTWDNEQFAKKILPNFKTFDADDKGKWLRNYFGRFNAYCNTKKTPESGTINQFWLLVKKCADDKCEDACVWMELWRCAFTIAYSITEKTELNDEVRRRIMMPFETYMVEYLKKCDLFKRKDEPCAETKMRIICIEILLHTRHPDVTDTLRKLTFNEKLEVPLRMLTSACYTRERDEKPKTVEDQYKRVLQQSVLDPHIAEGWGTYLQHCLFGLGAYLITQTDTKQYKLFEELYQATVAKDPEFPRKFSPSDWMYAYKGASLHENSAKIAFDMFKKLNDDCILHIDTLLKQKHPDDAEEREKDREDYKKDMKEYTQLLADLIIGEEDFNEFKPHLHVIILFIGDLAKAGEPLSEDRIRERAINMGNMVRERDFAKVCNESLKAIGAKD